jgi:peptidoglycan hydrolase-like protein with peptidoglycan-binding domain
MARTYQDADLGRAEPADPALVRALQTDLRALGYLKQRIDGKFGTGTQLAVRRLEFDLLFNHGASSNGDGHAPVAMRDFKGGVTPVTGTVDAATASAIDALLSDPRIPHLPSSDDPKAANAAAIAKVRMAVSTKAPTPFILAIFHQESGGRHFAQPADAADTDSFITLGVDLGDKDNREDNVTSRGYGLGQYTLFHHPPRPEEITDFMLDPLRNAQKAFAELREKFDGFVAGPTSRADDRDAEHPLLALRLCR